MYFFLLLLSMTNLEGHGLLLLRFKNQIFDVFKDFVLILKGKKGEMQIEDPSCIRS